MSLSRNKFLPSDLLKSRRALRHDDEKISLIKVTETVDGNRGENELPWKARRQRGMEMKSALAED